MLRKFQAALISLCLLIGGAGAIPIVYAEEPATDETIIMRAVVRQVYKKISVIGGYAIAQGYYYLDSNGNVYDADLTISSATSGLSVWGLEVSPSGPYIYIDFSYSGPSGGATVFHYQIV